MQDDEVSLSELSAFVDGELDQARHRAIAARILAEPALAERVAGLEADKRRLQQIYGPLIEQPVPQALLDRVAAASAPRPSIWATGIAAAMAAAIAVLAALWFAYGHFLGAPPDPLLADPLVAEALAARNGALPTERQMAADALASAETRDRIVADTLAQAVKVPDLHKAGYDLAAITVYPQAAQRQALQLRYRNGQGLIFTVYLAHRPEAEGFELIGRGQMRICVWRTEELSAVMVGEMSTNEMLRVASLTYADLNF